MGSVSEARNPVIDHPILLTSFKGIRHGVPSSEQEVWQFRGIRYGNVSARFQQSTLNATFSMPVHDATYYGPKCPQPQFPVRLEDELIALPPGITSHSEDIFDEFNCLNLNITTPRGVDARSDLPVVIYIHGGGGFSGSNGDWWCDGGSIVKRSMQIERPVVAVGINYRLSILGFIGSEELGTVYGKENIGNQGLRDANTAIRWIHQHIVPFGGSPEKLTIYGESYGSVIVDFLLRTHPVAPISRAIAQSGQIQTPISTPKSLAEHDTFYSALKQHLKVTTLSELQSVPYPDLLAAQAVVNPASAIGPSLLIDGQVLTETWSEDFSFPGTLMIGNTGNEECVLQSVCAWFPRVSPPPTFSTLITMLSSILPESTINAITSAYGISEKIGQEELVDKLLKLGADIIFVRPAFIQAAKWKKQGNVVQQYIFEQPQPFSGPYKGKAAHSLDLAYLHGNPSIFSTTSEPEQELQIQRAMQDVWIGFAHGEKGWGEKVRRFGPGEIVDEDVEVAFRKWNRGEAFKSWEALGSKLENAIVGVISGFVGSLIGFESH